MDAGHGGLGTARHLPGIYHRKAGKNPVNYQDLFPDYLQVSRLVTVEFLDIRDLS